jgi:predicted deacylase
MKMQRNVLIALVLSLVFSVCSGAGAQMRYHDIRPGYGVTELRWLSDYLPALRDTAGDTPVYVLQGEQPGGSMLLLGGTHGDEIAGIMAATWLVEKLSVQAGTVFVIPRANNSASTHHAANRKAFIELQTLTGTRKFAYGTRLTNPLHQSPDPAIYVHPDGRTAEGTEARNLNRVYPGKADGTLTEQVAFAIMELIRNENIDFAFDLHEAGPTSRLANMIVSNPKSIDYAAEGLLTMEIETNLTLKLEMSSTEFDGLSHREWGDHTQAQAILLETPNPGQSNANSVDVVNDATNPLSLRVATHLSTVQAIMSSWNAANSGKQVVWDNIPTFEEFQSKPLGFFYND